MHQQSETLLTMSLNNHIIGMRFDFKVIVQSPKTQFLAIWWFHNHIGDLRRVLIVFLQRVRLQLFWQAANMAKGTKSVIWDSHWSINKANNTINLYYIVLMYNCSLLFKNIFLLLFSLQCSFLWWNPSVLQGEKMMRKWNQIEKKKDFKKIITWIPSMPRSWIARQQFG